MHHREISTCSLAPSSFCSSLLKSRIASHRWHVCHTYKTHAVKTDGLSPSPIPVKHCQGIRRCFVVRPLVDDPSPPKDANEALLAGRNIREFLEGKKWPLP